jgi:uncharacterized repeat protein (TIGR01451 family)
VYILYTYSRMRAYADWGQEVLSWPPFCYWWTRVGNRRRAGVLPRALKGLQAIIVLLLITGVGCIGPTPAPESPAEETAPSEATEPSPEPGPQPSTPAAPAPQTAEELTVLSVAEGEVLIMKSGSDEWAGTEAGTTIEEGDALRTGEGSHALVTFFDGSTIELEAGTEIEAVELRHDVEAGITTIRLDQAIGNTLSRVKKLADPACRYEVATPAAVGAVRGSAMRVNVDADGTSTVVNLAGSVTISAEGVTVEIPPGYQSVVQPGQKPGSPGLPAPGGAGGDRDGGGAGGGGTTYTAAIAVNKTARSTAVHEGDTVAYTYNVTNPGEVALENVSVTDDTVAGVAYQAGDADGDGRLDVGEAWLFAASYNVSDRDASPLVNVATASGSIALGGGGWATVSATDTATVTVLRPGIALNKTAEATVVHVGDTVSYSYNVTNGGNAPLSEVTVTDEGLEVAYDVGDADGDGWLDVGEAWVFRSSRNVTGGDESPLVNTASVNASDGLGLVVRTHATCNVTILRPSIGLNKTAEPTVVRVGDTVSYSYNVTNQGNAALANVDLVDDRVDDVAYRSGDDNGNGQLDVDEAWIFCGNYTVALEDESPLVNTASVNASDGLGLVVGAEVGCNVTILRLDVEITSPDDDSATTDRSITVEGLVSDPRVGTVNVTVNGSWYEVTVEEGEFSQAVPVVSGANTITVTAANEWGESDSDSVTVYAHFELPAIQIELTWDATGDDLDGHFIRPGGRMWVEEDDCYYWWLDHPPYAPDWDGSGDLSPGDPVLDVDDRMGGGPERVTLEVPFESGQYHYKVHFFSDMAPVSGSTATVSIWIDNVLEFTRSETLQDDEVWDCAYIEWPSGLVHAGAGLEEGLEGNVGGMPAPEKN